MTRFVRPTVALGLAAVGITALAACSSDSSGDSGKSSGSASQAAGTSRVANVVVTNAKGCTPDATAYQAGAVTFKVRNQDATAVSEVEVLAGERILGEKENLPPGFSGSFTVDIPAGSYQLYCPGATPERTAFKVTGKSSGGTDTTTAGLLAQGTKGYGTYVNTQVAALVTEVAKFNTTLQGTNLAAAQTAYMKARPFYERIEPVAESFVIGKDSIDADIDLRDDQGIDRATWRGFHRIELGLFQQKSLSGMAAYGTKLVSDVNRLQGLTKNLTYKPSELANGAQGLLDEVSANKITGEEERYSHIDLLDFAGNVEGAEQAFAQLQPALNKIDKTLADTISTRFQALDTLLAKYKTDSNASGYKLYTALTAADKSQLAASVKNVQEPLSQVSSKVANA